MVAYSFKEQFIEPIEAGAKCQTIRAPRRRHARSGETIQLYTAMRTKKCRLIGTAICWDVRDITIAFSDDPEAEGIILPGFGYPGGLEGFARADGFASWGWFKAFWRKHYPEALAAGEFTGVLISWDRFEKAS
jgi:hypothetical protein